MAGKDRIELIDRIIEKKEMERKQPAPAMTYEEASMEQSKSFVRALQELKNLSPQLYSAAEHYEKSYHHSDEKHKVLHNLKDYAVQVLVNAVDHLGTIAYNLNNLVEENTMVISSSDTKITSLNQKLLTCQTYVDKEGLRQQQMKANIPRHHKHYTLPSSVNKKVHFSPIGERSQARTRQLYRSDTPAANTLSWYLASETKSSLKRCQLSGSLSANSSKASNATLSSLGDTETSGRTIPNVANSPFVILRPASTADTQQTLGIKPQVVLESSRATTPLRSIDSPSRKAIIRAPMQSKNLLFACLMKQKKQKPKTTLLL